MWGGPRQAWRVPPHTVAASPNYNLFVNYANIPIIFGYWLIIFYICSLISMCSKLFIVLDYELCG